MSSLSARQAELELQKAREAGGARNVIEQQGFSVFGMFNKAFSAIATASFIAPMAGGLVGWAASKNMFSRVSGPMKTISELAKYPEKPLEEVLGHATQAIHASPRASAVASSIAQVPGAGKVSHYANKVLSTGVKDSLMKTSTSQALFAGSMVVGQAATTVGTFSGRMRTLKQMQLDLTGEKPSTLSLMLGTAKLHPLVAQARGEATGMRAKAATLLSVAGMAGDIYMMLFDRSGGGLKWFAKSAAIGMGTSAVAGIVTSGQTALKGYSDMTLRMAHTGKAELDDYVNLIGGLAQNANAQMVQKVAEQAFAKQLKPKDVLQMMAETTFLKPSSAVPANDGAKKPVTIGGKVFTPHTSFEQGHVAALAAKAANGAAVARSA